ncbi:MAG: mechanosensitive ion channel family protein, partial [Alphaproteobacteria bacterium]
ICAVTIIWAMIRSVLAPNRPEWRVLNISDRSARRLCWLATGVAVIHAGDAILSKLNFILESPLPLTVAQHFVTSVAVALLLMIMLRMPLSEGSASTQEAPGQRRLTRALLRAILWVCVLVMLASAFLGYVAFARFLMNQVVLTASLIILFYLLHIGIEDFANSLTDPERPAGRWLKDNLDLEPQRHAHLGLLASLFLHILLLCLFIPILLLQWGFDWEDIRLWGTKLLFGFEVGQWKISLAAILISLLIFILGLFATRMFQNWLDSKILQRANFEQGARSAIRTGVGYAGFAIAALLAVSYAGLDFSNIAIIAGALSVGIGFGLQNIVNNFVSGLILLAERRVSVGDWIVVGNDEGYVRRISVRATE